MLKLELLVCKDDCLVAMLLVFEWFKDARQLACEQFDIVYLIGVDTVF